MRIKIKFAPMVYIALVDRLGKFDSIKMCMCLREDNWKSNLTNEKNT